MKEWPNSVLQLEKNVRGGYNPLTTPGTTYLYVKLLS